MRVIRRLRVGERISEYRLTRLVPHPGETVASFRAHRATLQAVLQYAVRTGALKKVGNQYQRIDQRIAANKASARRRKGSARRNPVPSRRKRARRQQAWEASPVGESRDSRARRYVDPETGYFEPRERSLAGMIANIEGAYEQVRRGSRALRSAARRRQVATWRTKIDGLKSARTKTQLSSRANALLKAAERMHRELWPEFWGVDPREGPSQPAGKTEEAMSDIIADLWELLEVYGSGRHMTPPRSGRPQLAARPRRRRNR